MDKEQIEELKEQIKQEILKEMNTKKENESNWSKIKKEYEEEFKKLITRERDIYTLQNATGTILRIICKTDSVNRININYEEAKEIVEGILGIMKNKQKEVAQ